VPPDLDSLIAEANAHPLEGWDFAWIGDRLRSSSLPWSYRAMAVRLAQNSPDLLDLGTGGGEWLAALEPRPSRTVATEGWPPNLGRARARLEPLGIEVVSYDGPRDNIAQRDDEPPLPFPDNSFRLVINRHESFLAREVARVLVPGGRFLTQQVGGGHPLAELLGVPVTDPPPAPWKLAEAVSQVERAGLRVSDSGQAEQIETIADVGALVWYLNAVPWELPTFRPSTFRGRLEELYQTSKAGPLEIRRDVFWLIAEG